MRKSYLPQGGTNLFQMIKRVCTEAEERGQRLYRLSIGQPTGPALLPAREAAAAAIMSEAESMHEYQDNGSPGLPGFAQRFVQAHVTPGLSGADVSYLPIPGIKPMLGLIPLACGAAQSVVRVLTTVKPGYPTPGDWCGYLGVVNVVADLTMQNGFRFAADALGEQIDLVMTNYPHNPTGQVATYEWWATVCEFSVRHNVRVFNDAAYAVLAHSTDHRALAEVAVNFPDLSWAEAFSASKAGNFTGWRVGAIVGSPDFVADIATIKGNTDSGFVAPMAAGILSLFEGHRNKIEAVRQMYERRSRLLIETLRRHGMRLAVQPGAGFFTLWQTPKRAFGEAVESAAHFNFTMVERTGVVGVHFDPYIRYAVCGDVEGMIGPIEQAFEKADVSYD